MKATFLITDPKSRILYASPGSERRAGFDIPEMIGKRPGEIWGGLMPRTFYENFWRVINLGMPYTGRVENKKKNGDRYLQDLHIAPISDENSKVKYFLEIHPSTASIESEKAFARDFSRYANQSSHPSGIIRLLNDWGGEKIDARISSRARLLEVVRANYIRPIEETYKTRNVDKELILESQASPECFAELYKKYAGQVRAFFLHRVKSEALAEDCTHEVFERAFKALPDYRPSNASYLTYLLRVSHNLLVSHYRKRDVGELTLHHKTEFAQRIEARDAVQRGLERLSPGDRELIHMKYERGMKVKEIAILLKTSQNAIKLRLSRTRKKLREIIEKGG